MFARATIVSLLTIIAALRHTIGNYGARQAVRLPIGVRCGVKQVACP